MKFFDDKRKSLKWYNSNYFYLGTVIVISLNILLFAVLGNTFSDGIGGDYVWSEFNLNNLYRGFLNAFEHSNWQHVLLNMLCFLFCGLYIERKTGTLKFLFLVFGLTVIESAFTIANSLSINFHGASGLVYICYAYIIVDYLFSFVKSKRDKTNTIFGAIIVALIYFAMCFNGGVSSFSFKPYPYDLIHNTGHYASFIGGIIVSLMIQISQLKYLKNFSLCNSEQNKNFKLAYMISAILVCTLCIITPILSIKASTRINIDYYVNLDCNIDKFDTKLKYNYPKKRVSLQGYVFNDFYSRYEQQQRYGYIFEIFKDNKHTKRIDYSQTAKPLHSGTEFIPLAKPINLTYYIKMYEGYEVFINYSDLETYYYSTEVISDCYNDNLYSFYRHKPSRTLIVKKDQPCKFKLLNPKYNNLIVKANGQELVLDENGYYTIENVTENINISFSR